MTNHPFDVLNDRQRAVAERLMTGASLRSISDELGISYQMVRKLSHECYVKLGLAKHPIPRVRMILLVNDYYNDRSPSLVADFVEDSA